jgi:hypothetical protein
MLPTGKNMGTPGFNVGKASVVASIDGALVVAFGEGGEANHIRRSPDDAWEPLDSTNLVPANTVWPFYGVIEKTVYVFTDTGAGIALTPSTSSTWRRVARMKTYGYRGCSAVVGGKLYAIGGTRSLRKMVDVYTAETNTWEVGGAPDVPNNQFGACAA